MTRQSDVKKSIVHIFCCLPQLHQQQSSTALLVCRAALLRNVCTVELYLDDKSCTSRYYTWKYGSIGAIRVDLNGAASSNSLTLDAMIELVLIGSDADFEPG